MVPESRSEAIRVVLVLEATAGGTRRYLRELVAALRSDEFDLRVVCANRRAGSFEEDIASFRARGIETHVLPMTRAPHPVLDPLAVIRLRSLLRRAPCDVLHLNSAKAGWIGRLAAWNLDCRVVYSPHGFPFLQRSPLSLPKLYEWAERVTARRTDLLLAVGADEGRVAVGRGLFESARVRIVRNAIDVERVEREVGRRRSIPDDPAERVVGMIGELRRQKDPMCFLEALRILRARGRFVRAVLPAEGKLLARARRFLCRANLQEQVELLPSDGSLSAIYRRTDIGVMPSRWEGLPYSLLDALALGIPVLGSDIGPLTDLLAPIDPRLAFRAGRPDALADALEVLLTAPSGELESIGGAAREIVLRDHSSDKWRAEMINVYRSLV